MTPRGRCSANDVRSPYIVCNVHHHTNIILYSVKYCITRGTQQPSSPVPLSLSVAGSLGFGVINCTARSHESVVISSFFPPLVMLYVYILSTRTHMIPCRVRVTKHVAITFDARTSVGSCSVRYCIGYIFVCVYAPLLQRIE